MADLLIRGGLLVDGTGAPARVADVSVTNGVISGIGDSAESASEVVDATGLVVSPGFVDLHTHYDAQLFWDPTASPSPLHGVTTVFGGNCGFTLAPAGEEHAEYLMRLMARVEGMPLEALEAGLPWDWTSYADWHARLEGNIGINAGFLVGHSAVRRAVMGCACHEEANPEQIAEMARLVREACRAGALGVSTSTAPTHNDGDGEPVPSRAASDDELLALATAAGEVDGTTTVELILAGCINGFSDEEVDLMTRVSLAANRPVNWNVLGVSAMNPTGHENQLRASDVAGERGGKVIALTLPHNTKIRLSFLSGFVLDGLPGWRPVMALPPKERIKALRDPETRKRLAEGASSEEAGVLRALANWGRLQLVETFAPENADFEGKRVSDVVEAKGGDPFDALLDIVLADELRTGLSPGGLEAGPEDWKLRAEVWRDPRTVVGGSDAGAHLDMMCGAIYSTALLAHGVREQQVITLEEAIHQLTDVPARLYGLKNRGRIADGHAADLVLFDPDRVGYGQDRTRADLPGGAARLYAEAQGIESVFVNGTRIVDGGQFTGATPGTLLKSARDTDTVPAAASG